MVVAIDTTKESGLSSSEVDKKITEETKNFITSSVIDGKIKVTDDKVVLESEIDTKILNNKSITTEYWCNTIHKTFLFSDTGFVNVDETYFSFKNITANNKSLVELCSMVNFSSSNSNENIHFRYMYKVFNIVNGVKSSSSTTHYIANNEPITASTNKIARCISSTQLPPHIECSIALQINGLCIIESNKSYDFFLQVEVTDIGFCRINRSYTPTNNNFYSYTTSVMTLQIFSGKTFSTIKDDGDAKMYKIV